MRDICYHMTRYCVSVGSLGGVEIALVDKEQHTQPESEGVENSFLSVTYLAVTVYSN